MRRRIIKQGNNSFTSTVPIKWIKENNLEAGDEIEVFEEDNQLIISESARRKFFVKTFLFLIMN